MNNHNFSNIHTISCVSLYAAFFFVLYSTAALNLFILISIFFGLLKLFILKDFEKINLRIFYYSSMLFGLLTISIAYTTADTESINETFFKYIKLLYLPILFYIVSSKNIINRAFNSFHIGATLLLFLSYLKFFGLFDPEIVTNALDLRYANKLRDGATIFQHAIIHGILFSFYGVSTFLKGSNGYGKYYYILSLLSFSNVLLINISRTGYLIALCLILLIFIRSINKTKFKFELIAFTISIMTLFAINSDNINKRFYDARNDILKIEDSYYNTSIGYRFLWLQNGINNLREKPIFGHGIGSYKNTIKIYIDKNNIQHDDLNAIGNNPHSEFVSISSQLGIAGLFIYLVFLLSLLFSSRGDFLLKAIFLIILISSLFNTLFFNNVSGLFAAIIIILGLRNKEFGYLK